MSKSTISTFEVTALRDANATLREALSDALGYVVAVIIAGQKEAMPQCPPPYQIEGKIRAALAGVPSGVPAQGDAGATLHETQEEECPACVEEVSDESRSFGPRHRYEHTCEEYK